MQIEICQPFCSLFREATLEIDSVATSCGKLQKITNNYVDTLMSHNAVQGIMEKLQNQVGLKRFICEYYIE